MKEIKAMEDAKEEIIEGLRLVLPIGSEHCPYCYLYKDRIKKCPDCPFGYKHGCCFSYGSDYKIMERIYDKLNCNGVINNEIIALVKNIPTDTLENFSKGKLKLLLKMVELLDTKKNKQPLIDSLIKLYS